MKTITGSVVDYDTGQPVVGADVMVGRIGWGMARDQLVWDKGYFQTGVTDSVGAFTLSFNAGKSVRVSVLKEGYVDYFGWHAADRPVQVQLKNAHVAGSPLPSHMAEIGLEEFQPYGWIFAEQRRTFDAAEADIFPEFPADFLENFLRNSAPIRLHTREPGGIQALGAQDMGVTADFLVYPDIAPEDGYATTYQLQLSPITAENTQILFIRTRDGQHYAKCEFNPTSYTTLGSERDAQQGTRGMWLQCVYNPMASRRLPYRK